VRWEIERFSSILELLIARMSPGLKSRINKILY
jgi:hypothetical protein